MGVLALSSPSLTKDSMRSDEKNVWVDGLTAEKLVIGVGRSKICELS